MKKVRFNKFTGLRPKLGTLVSDDALSTATEAVNVDCRKLQLMPIMSPRATTIPCPVPVGNMLLVDGMTGAWFCEYETSGLVRDSMRDPAVFYKVDSMEGASAYYFSDRVAPMRVPVPANPLGIEIIAGNTTLYGEALTEYKEAQAAASLATSRLLIEEPSVIKALRAASPSVEYNRTEVNAAIERVWHTYTIQHSTSDTPQPITLFSAYNQILEILDQKAEVVRENAGDHPRHPFIEIKDTIEAALKTFTERLALYVYRELTGSLPDNLVEASLSAKLPCPAIWLSNTLEIVPLMQVSYSDDANRPTYSTGQDIPLDLTGVYYETHSYLSEVFKLAATSYSTYALKPKETIPFVLDEIETCRTNLLANGTYIWKGLDATLAALGQQMQPYTPSDSALDGTVVTNTHFVPRVYTYTFIDSLGRESQPCVTITHALAPTPLDAASPSTHVITVPPIPHAFVTHVAVYRMIADQADKSATAEFSRVALVAVEDSNASIEVSVPIDCPPLYTSLTTLHNEWLPYNADPEFMVQTASGYTVCTDASRNTIYVSARHVPYVFPLNRRVSMPEGVMITAMKVVDSVIYVGTSECPAFMVFGEDAGIDGLDITFTYLSHAKFPCVNNVSHTASPWGVLWWTTAGLALQALSDVVILSADLIDEDQVPAYGLSVSHMAFHNGMLYSWVGDVCTIFDIPDKTFGETVIAPMTQAIVPAISSRSFNGSLILMPPPDSGNLAMLAFGEGTTPLAPQTYRTHPIYVDFPTVFTAMRITGKNVVGVITVYDADDSVAFTVDVVPTMSLYRLPVCRIFDSVSVRFEGTFTVLAEIVLATSVEELSAD